MNNYMKEYIKDRAEILRRITELLGQYHNSVIMDRETKIISSIVADTMINDAINMSNVIKDLALIELNYVRS